MDGANMSGHRSDETCGVHFRVKVLADGAVAAHNARDDVSLFPSCCLLGGGGNVNNNNNLVPSESVFGNLPRPVLIPEKKRPFQPPPTTSSPADVQLLCSLLWSGEVDFCVMTNDTEKSEAVVTAMVLSESFQDVAFQQMLFTYVFPSEGSCSVVVTRGHPSGEYLHDEHRNQLMQRVLHRFLRHHGVRLPFKPCEVATSWLVALYLSDKMYDEALDVSIIAADVAIGNPECSAALDIGTALQTVGELLEAKGKFETAGALFLEMATTRVASDLALVSLCYQNAGLAYKRCQDYQLAEECYVKALFYSHRIHSKRWDVNASHVRVLFRNILFLYDSINVSSFHNDSSGNVEQFALDNVEPSLTGLLCSAGYDFHCDKKLSVAFEDAARKNLASLKNKFQSPKNAKRALIEASKSSSDVQTFRSILVSCWNQNTHNGSYILSPKEVDPVSRKDAKKAARKYVKDSSDLCFYICATCSVLESKPGEFLRCPCQVRSIYLDAHWQLKRDGIYIDAMYLFRPISS
jgi:tetratricopeptide (TPR) repeat protein